jgi:uncharacterized protein YjbJ (UPF0337 family)
MDANQDILKGKWPALKSQAQQHWGKLTDEDIQRHIGTMEKLAGVLRQRYGYGEAQAEMEISQWVSRHDTAPVKI